MGAGQIFAQFAQHAGLGCCELEAELCEKRFHQMVVASAREGLRFGFKISAAKLNLPLQADKLIQRQPAAGQFDVLRLVREMNQVDGAGAGREGRGVREEGRRGRGALHSDWVKGSASKRPPLPNPLLPRGRRGRDSPSPQRFL